MCRSVVVVAVLAGCGRVAFEPLGGDGGTDAERCDEPFGPPVQISSGMYVRDPALADDDLELYTGDLATLYVQTRPTTTSAWGARVPVVLPPSNDAYNEYSPSLSSDGLTLYFTSGRMGGAPVMRSTRASRSAPWEAEVDTGARGGADIRADDLEIVFQDFTSPVRHMTRATTMEPFANEMALPGPVNDGSQTGGPSLSRDGLDLYVNSTRGGTMALYVAHRASLTADFATVVALGIEGEVPEISADGRDLYFVRGNGVGYDLWRTSRCD